MIELLIDLSIKCNNNSNAFYWRSSCYVFNPVQMKKEQANYICNLYGKGHLAFITTPALAVLAASFINPVSS